MSVMRGSFFQRGLTKLYADTKSTYENVTRSSSKTNNNNTLLTIQHEFSVQKDRLLSWGLDWSDSTAAQPHDIDVSLNRAGFSEVVAGVMSTIQDLLNEVERLQEPPDLPPLGVKLADTGSKTKRYYRSSSTDQKRVKSHWSTDDIQRSSDLLQELKTAIDTLYELSRCRSISRSPGTDGLDRKKLAADSVRSFKSIVEGFEPKMGCSKHPLETKSSFSPSNDTFKTISPSVEGPNTFYLSQSTNRMRHKTPSLFYGISRRPSLGTIPTVASFRSAPAVETALLRKITDDDILTAKNWNQKGYSMHPLYINRNALDLSSHPPPYEVVVGSSDVRQVGTLKASGIWRQYAVAKPPNEKSVPVMVEYVSMTSGFRASGMLLPQERLSELSRGIQKIYQARRSNRHISILGFLGYFVDLACSRYAFVYLLPPKIPSPTSGTTPQVSGAAPRAEPRTLFYLFKNSENMGINAPDSAVPTLDQRFELAYALLLAILHLSSQHIVHGQINSKNVVFLPSGSTYDISQPLISSFAQFSETGVKPPPEELSCRIYRHPEDQRRLTDPSAWAFDLYSLGLVLLEIALWMPIEKFWKPKYDNANFKLRIQKIYLQKISSKCGTLYRDAVRMCLEAPDCIGIPGVSRLAFPHDEVLKALGLQTMSRNLPKQTMPYVLQIADKLHRCCALTENHQPIDEELEMVRANVNPYWLPGLKQQNQLSTSDFVKENNAYEDYLRGLQDNIGQKTVDVNNLQRENKTLRKESESRQQRIEELEKQLKALIQEKGPETKGLPPPQHQPEKLYEMSLEEKGRDPTSLFTPSAIAAPESRSELPAKLTPQNVTEANAKPPGTSSNSSVPSIPDHLPAVAGPSQVPNSPKPSESQPRNGGLRKWSQFDIPQSNLDDWNTSLMPKLNKLLQRALKDSPESSSASLMMVGETADEARPTICITCSSTSKVRSILKRHFRYNTDAWGLIVVRGDVRRSKQPRRRRRKTRRSLKGRNSNPFYQKRPMCGASIGAFRDSEHLPPVSYGGAILVDDVPYGMTVHHMLDAPSDDDSDLGDYETLRSAGEWGDHFDYSAEGFKYCPVGEEHADHGYSLEISEDEYDQFELDYADFSEDDFDGEDLSDDEGFNEDDEDAASVGDTCGIIPGVDDHLIVTQPAIDDVEDEYFPRAEDRNEDHLSSHSLGYVHASSGVRRWIRNGIKHEVDWALIRIDDERLEVENGVSATAPSALSDEFTSSPNFHQDNLKLDRVASMDDMSGLQVHCCGRTSGLQRGRISPAMTLVKMYGRRSFSSSWCVDGNFGVPGDSGAWVFSKASGLVCGHVLAYCAKTRTTFMAPMEILFQDIANTLGARNVTLPTSCSYINRRPELQTQDPISPPTTSRYTSLMSANTNSILKERPTNSPVVAPIRTSSSKPSMSRSRSESPRVAKGKQPNLSLPQRLSTELTRLSLRGNTDTRENRGRRLEDEDDWEIDLGIRSKKDVRTHVAGKRRDRIDIDVGRGEYMRGIEVGAGSGGMGGRLA